LIRNLTRYPQGTNAGKSFSLAVVAAACIALTVGLFFVAHRNAQSRLVSDFEGDAKIRTHLAVDRFRNMISSLDILRRYSDDLDDIRRQEFTDLIAPVSSELGSGLTFQWIPRVPFGQRALYEEKARTQGFTHFNITEADTRGGIVISGRRDVYYPAYYFEPMTGNERALGFDHGADPMRLDALQRAAETMKPTSTGRVSLSSEAGGGHGLIVYYPVYREKMPVMTAVQRKTALVGFIAVAIRFDEVLRDALAFMQPQDITIDLVDHAARENERVISHIVLAGSPHPSTAGHGIWYPQSLQYVRYVTFAGRQLRFDVRAGEGYIKRHYDLSHWLILPVGLLLSMVLSLFLHSALTRKDRAEAMVQQRTTELRLSEKKYRGLFEQNREGLVICDLEGVILDANRATLEMTGYSLDEMHYRPYRDFTPEKWHELDADIIRNQLFKQGFSEFQDRECIRKDGTVLSTSVRAWLLRDTEEGKPTGVIVWLQDITERKKIEEQSHLNQARMESLLKITQATFATVQELLDFALNESICLTGSTIGYIYFYDDVSREFTLNTWSKDVMKECTIQEKKTLYELDKTGIWGEAVRQGQPIMLNDFSAFHPLKRGYPEGHAHLDRFLTIPVFSNERIVAVVGVANKKEDYTEADVKQLRLLMHSVWQVVDRKSMEQALQAERDRVQMYLETAEVMLLVLDSHGSVTLINRKGCELTGRTEQEIVGRDWLDLCIPQEERDRVRQAFEEIMDGVAEPAQYHENSIVTKQGSRRLIAWRSTLLKDESGAVMGVLSSGEDITERRITEIRLNESRDRFRKIIDDMPLAASYTDEKGSIEFSNRVFVELFGYTPEEIPTIEDWFVRAYPDPDYREEVMARWNADATRARVEGTRIGPGEYNITCKDGAVRTCEITGTFLEHGLMAVFNDITERIQAEERLRQSEERFRVQFRGIPVPTYIWEHRSGDFYLLDYNDAAIDFTRGRISSYSGISASRFYEGKSWFVDDMKRCFEEQIYVENRFWDTLRTTGEKKFIAVKYAYVPPNLVMVHMEDITLQKEAEEHLRYLSMHDPLTGLYNRLYADTEIERLKSSRKYPVSVMVVDIDGLKVVNDNEGHAAGDQLIKNAAYILKQTFRPEDMVARIGGDEFLVLLPMMDGITLDQSLRRLKVYLTNFNASSPDTPVSFSVGSATAHSSDDLENCIKQADMVMYLEKAKMKALQVVD